MSWKHFVILCVTIVSILLLAGTAQAIDIETVNVGNAGNLADTTGYGSVGYDYKLGKYEVSNAQYQEFLNAKAAVGDPYGLYNYNMAGIYGGGIARTGSGTLSDPWVYCAKSNDTNWDNRPVAYVNFWDATRFCNWLQNGKGSADTETGAYLNIGNQSTFARQAGARYYIPNEDEWYKAAYYKGGGTNAGYWNYATQSNATPISQSPAGGSNSANYYGSGLVDPTHLTTTVGAYYSSQSAYGTFDQTGNVNELNETAIGSSRLLRGGSFDGGTDILAKSSRLTTPSTYESTNVGFRVAKAVIPPMISTDTAPPNPGSTHTQSGQLLMWSESGWVPASAGGVASDKETIVLTHGWHASLYDDEFQVLATAYKNSAPADKQLGSDYNILGWEWKDKANPSNLSFAWEDISISGLSNAQKAINNGVSEGMGLAGELLQLNINPTKLQLFGHSAGAAVVGTTAKVLSNATTGEVKRLTIADAPHLYLLETDSASLGIVALAVQGITHNPVDVAKLQGTQADALQYIDPTQAQEVEVYFSGDRSALGFGEALLGKNNTCYLNVFNGEVYPNSTYMHGYVRDWYADVGTELVPPPDPKKAINWSILNPNAPIWETGDFYEQGANTGNFGSTSFSQQPVNLAIKSSEDFESGGDWKGLHTNIKPISFGFAAEMSEGSDAYLFKEMTVPIGSDYLTFDLAVEDAGDGDFLTVSFGNEVLFYQDLTMLGTQEFSTVLPIFIGDIEGQTGTFLFALNSQGEANASIMLDNINFLQAVPEPSSLILIIIGAISLLGYTWRRLSRGALISATDGRVKTSRLMDSIFLFITFL